MYTIIFLLFIIGYFFIALEHNFHIDKAASALLTAVSVWTILAIGSSSLGIDLHGVKHHLTEHLSEISEIIFFLLGAMTIVELIDVHNGFEIITDKITTKNKKKLLWLIAFTSFFMSSVLDNLTTTIVMIALLKKILTKKEDLWFFGGIVVIAANSGGAWSPIGDVTTIMLWAGEQISAKNIVFTLILPSLVCLLVPLIFASIFMKSETIEKNINSINTEMVSKKEQYLVFCLGVGGLLFVPIFKNISHLPPYMGMLLSLSVLWIVTELLHKNKFQEHKTSLSVAGVIRRIDTPSILFFLGILLAVAGLQTAGHLKDMATILDENINNIYITNLAVGLLSAIVDNVPLVAGAMGMYSLEVYPQDDAFWELLAYCAGTGGSVLIIGSAAGVAMMGLLKVEFMWYVKRISLLALAGYVAGFLIAYFMV